jgi:AcrR family transcriptional regulator
MNSAPVFLLLVEAPVTLRERKKAATRQSLHEAVLRLAVARGLDAVTVEAVADEANVSRRTFSNYFANKEDALLYRDQVHTERLLLELRLRPTDEPPWLALTRGASTLYADLDELDATWLAQLRLVRQHPSVLARQIAAQSALELQLATEIAARSPAGTVEPMHSRVMSATFLATVRTAINVWAEHPARASLSQTVAAALAQAGGHFD